MEGFGGGFGVLLLRLRLGGWQKDKYQGRSYRVISWALRVRTSTGYFGGGIKAEGVMGTFLVVLGTLILISALLNKKLTERRRIVAGLVGLFVLSVGINSIPTKESKPETPPPTLEISSTDLVAALEEALKAKASLRNAFPIAKNELAELREWKISVMSGATRLEVLVHAYRGRVASYMVTISGPQAKEMAERYLPLLATLWVEGNDPREAASWVQSAIQKLSRQTPITRMVGEVEMVLGGGQRVGVYSFLAMHRDYESWLRARVKEMKEQK
ncbi:hypothetical protein [Thermus oshimai]